MKIPKDDNVTYNFYKEKYISSRPWNIEKCVILILKKESYDQYYQDTTHHLPHYQLCLCLKLSVLDIVHTIPDQII